MRLSAASLLLLPIFVSLTPMPSFAGDGSDPAQVDAQLTALPHRALGDRIPVTIYRFKSSVPDLDPQAATDMFVTALVKSGQFRVVERENFQPDLSAEHGLNASGQTTGDAAQHQFTGAKYIFEGAVSDLGQQTDSNSGQVSVDGMTVSGGGGKGRITVDVRIVDAGTGDVLDAVTYSQKLDNRHRGVQGVGNVLLDMTRGKLGRFTPDASGQDEHDDDYSDALRAAMEGSILALVKDIE